MKLIHTKENLQFYIDSEFNIKYLSPVQKYVEWKLESNNWDDYNELFHAAKYFEELKQREDICFDSHLLCEDDSLIGCVFIINGEIQNLEQKYSIESEKTSLLLKYFHIAKKGQGYGSYWLNSIILPYYKELGYEKIYLNSSHPISFAFYKKLGKEIATYEQQSDNNLHKRVGACFKIEI